jgi:hypothetical protein
LRHEKHILSVEIFSADGTILYSAGNKLDRRLIPDQWWRSPRLPNSRLWRFDDGTSLVVGSDIVGSIDTVVGGVALRAERATVARAASRLGRELRHVGALIFLVGGVLAAALALLLLRGVLHALDRSTGALQGLSIEPAASQTELLARETASNAAAILSAVNRATGEAGAPRGGSGS